MNTNLKNKVVIVTGGAGLLGREFVKAILRHGGIPVIAEINASAAQKLQKDLQKKFPRARVDLFKLDITSKDSLQKMIRYVNGQYGRIDALVNCAYPRNKNFGRKFEDVTYKDFCENVNLQLGGYFLSSQQIALYFKKQRFGHLINIASIYGVVPPRFEIYEGTNMTTAVEYGAVKSAIIALTKYMTKYFKGTNIRFNTVSPGGIWAGQPKTFLKKYRAFCQSKGMLQAKDVVGTLLFLLSDDSQAITGQNFIVDDGFVL